MSPTIPHLRQDAKRTMACGRAGEYDHTVFADTELQAGRRFPARVAAAFTPNVAAATLRAEAVRHTRVSAVIETTAHAEGSDVVALEIINVSRADIPGAVIAIGAIVIVTAA